MTGAGSEVECECQCGLFVVCIIPVLSIIIHCANENRTGTHHGDNFPQRPPRKQIKISEPGSDQDTKFRICVWVSCLTPSPGGHQTNRVSP